jgi:hypothetical protein
MSKSKPKLPSQRLREGADKFRELVNEITGRPWPDLDGHKIDLVRDGLKTCYHVIVLIEYDEGMPTKEDHE